MSDYVTCDWCRDGSCRECEGNGGWEAGGKWVTCPTCNGLGTCQECLGEVTTLNPFVGSILPILPNDLETWADVLAPTPKR